MDDEILKLLELGVPQCVYRVNIPIGNLKDNLQLYKVDLNPEYQRGHVWTEKQESLFVGAFLENPRGIPPFWFNWTNNKKSCEVVDGKQRLKACQRWLNGEIDAIAPNGIIVRYADLGKVDLTRLRTMHTLEWHFVDLDRGSVMKFYLRLNSGGTIHTQEELDKVRSLVAQHEGENK